MDTQELIDIQFDRAVQIVQGLPKNGPIQTGYEEKLAMYSLYKQATVGNVKGNKPAIWDMLGRAKWEAWAKHENLDSYEAKWLYVDELMRVLKKYSDKTVAQDLVKELESYGGGPSNTALGGTMPGSGESDSDSSRASSPTPGQQRRVSRSQSLQQPQRPDTDDENNQSGDEEGDQLGSNLHGQPISQSQNLNQSMLGRPQSSLSTHRYRTPMGGSLIMSPPPIPAAPMPTHPLSQQQHYAHPTHPSGVYVQPQSVHHVYGATAIPAGGPAPIPNVQPMPNFETPSAFPGPSPPVSSPSMHPSLSVNSAAASVSALGASSYANVVHPYPANMYPGHPSYRAAPSGASHSHSPAQIMVSGQGMGMVAGSGLTGARSPLERAVENVQAHLSALQERMEVMEARTIGGTPFASRASFGGGPLQRTSPHGSPFGSYFGGAGGRGGSGDFWSWLTEFDAEYFDWGHMGLWSVALAPLARLTKFLTRVLAFLLARRGADGSQGRERISPGIVVLRRLLLDASFILCALIVGRKVWRRSGMRRKEVLHALAGVWGAIVGRSGGAARTLVDRGV